MQIRAKEWESRYHDTKEQLEEDIYKLKEDMSKVRKQKAAMKKAMNEYDRYLRNIVA